MLAAAEPLTIPAEGHTQEALRFADEIFAADYAGRRIQEPQFAVPARGCHHLAVGTEGHTGEAAYQPGEDPRLLVQPPPEEVPFPTAPLFRALFQQIQGAGAVVRRQLALGQGDPRSRDWPPARC